MKIIDWFVFLVVTLSVLANGVIAAAYAADQPNIVIILVDDMGYGDAGCYNPKSKIPTPNIDSLAANGMRFTDAHASGPLCHVSRYGLMTGKAPFRATPNKWRVEPSIKSNQMTIASLLKSNGYRTAMVGKWHLGFDESGGYEKPLRGGPVDVGFESFFGIRASTDIPPYFYIRDNKAVQPPTKAISAKNTEGWTNIQGEFWREGLISPDLQLKNVLPKFTAEAIDVIEKYSASKEDNPLFLYLAYPAPHTPWLVAPEFEGKSGASMYGDFTNMVDANIGQVLTALKQNDMVDNTMVVFTSDNGPVWYEKDVERFGHDSSGGLRGMKADAWECGHRMPFLVRWPGVVKKGSTSDQMICFTDFLATFSELVGKELPTDAGPDSFSFLKVLNGTMPDGQSVRDFLVVAAGGKAMTIRKGNWKLINSLGSGGFSKPKRVNAKPGEAQGQLYDLDVDLGETDNLYQQQPELVSELAAKLKVIVESGRSRPK